MITLEEEIKCKATWLSWKSIWILKQLTCTLCSESFSCCLNAAETFWLSLKWDRTSRSMPTHIRTQWATAGTSLWREESRGQHRLVNFFTFHKIHTSCLQERKALNPWNPWLLKSATENVTFSNILFCFGDSQRSGHLYYNLSIQVTLCLIFVSLLLIPNKWCFCVLFQLCNILLLDAGLLVLAFRYCFDHSCFHLLLCLYSIGF